jgi:hypothetical protein
MLSALYNMPRDAVRALIVWALGGEPVLRLPDPAYDPAALDKVVSDIKNPAG